MMIDPHKLGGAMLAASPLLVNIGGEKWVWWLGVCMAVAGPFLMSLTLKPKRRN